MEVAAVIKGWHSSWVQAHELGRLNQDQREALARDVGLLQDELEALIAQGPEAAAELPRLLRALGLSSQGAEDLHPAVARNLSVVCSSCKFKGRCRNDIDCGWAPVVLRYCPNTSTIKALHRDRYELTLPCPPL